MENRLIYKTFNIKVDELNKLVIFKGNIGIIKKKFSGKDLIFFKKKIFFISKLSYINFLSYININYLGLQYGYYIEINFIGLGSRFLKFKNYLLLKLGYGHYIKYIIPKSIIVIGYKRTLIIYGIDLQEVMVMAKKIREFKK